MVFVPMLCESFDPQHVNQLNGTYSFERKWDGIRAVIAITPTSITITNRNGKDITYRYPDIVDDLKKAVQTHGETTMILDGEILVRDGKDFNFASVHTRDAQTDPGKVKAVAKKFPAMFVAFDILYDGVDIRNLPLRERREHLFRQQYVVRSVTLTMSAEAALAKAIDEGWEGIVAKADDSPYRAGRSPAWKKIKPTKSASLVVCGLEDGKGSRADTFGAAYVGLVEGTGFKVLGKVGSGFKQRDLDAIKARWAEVEAGRAEPPVVEVVYQERTTTGALRFPVFKGIRTDVSIADCTEGKQFA